MARRSISLTREQDEFVESVVRSGEYQDASEAIRDAIRTLQQRRKEDALKLAWLGQQLQAGLEDLDRGDFVEIDDAALETYLEGLGGIGKSGLL